MFENTFKTQISLRTQDAYIIDAYWNEIAAYYSRPDRHYHNLPHLENILAVLMPVKSKVTDWQTMVFSIAYHDIIYNTLKSNNEEKSAELAHNRLSALLVPIQQIDICCKQILATKGHNIINNEDINMFTDADLSILGTNSEEYNRYASLIREEYKLYPDFIYNTGRLKILKHFLRMQRIYKTDYFYNKYEEKARINIENEMKHLKGNI